MKLKSLVGNSALLLCSEALVNVSVFARNIILARILTKQDFGVAAALGLVLSLVELNGKASFGQQVIQSPKADDTSFVGTAQSMQLALGLLSGLVLIILGKPIAWLLQFNGIEDTVKYLSLPVLFISLMNLQLFRRMRQFEFVPQMLTDALPEIITTALAWPLVRLFNDYRVIVLLLTFKFFLFALVSNCVAGRRMRFSFTKENARSVTAFALPLFFSSWLLVGVSQGDRAIVANYFSLAQLGEYAVASSLAAAPMVALLKISGRIGLPALCAVAADERDFERRLHAMGAVLSVVGVAIVGGMICFGDQAIGLLYGAKYNNLGSLATLLVGSQCLRVIRNGPIIAAMAFGDTINNLIGNIVRISALVLVLPLLGVVRDVRLVGIMAVSGEALATAASVWLLYFRHRISVWAIARPIFIFCASVACFYFIGCTPMTTSSWSMTLLVYVGAVAASGFAFMLDSSLLREAAIGSLSMPAAVGSGGGRARGDSEKGLW